MATIDFQNKVMDAFASISDRLESIEAKLNGAAGLVSPPPGLGDDWHMLPEKTDPDEMVKRVSSIEKLLFGMHLDEYAKIDDIVARAVQLTGQQPELEVSPKVSMNPAYFDLFESSYDKGTQTEDSGDTDAKGQGIGATVNDFSDVIVSAKWECAQNLKGSDSTDCDSSDEVGTERATDIANCPLAEELVGFQGFVPQAFRRMAVELREELVEQPAAKGALWRCYNCWTHLAHEMSICRYCKDKTVVKRYEPDGLQ